MSIKQSIKCRQLLLMLAGLAQIVAVISSPSSPAQGRSQANCKVRGYTFRLNQVPALKEVPPSFNLKEVPPLINPVHLYTLTSTAAGSYRNPGPVTEVFPAPFADKAATLAACEADAACGLFTSNGYIIGAYRINVPEGQKEQKTDSESDILQWQPMYYCTWACCGTWVADGLIDQLLQPLPDTPGANNVQATEESKLPLDTEFTYELNKKISTTACVGKPAPGKLYGDCCPDPPCPASCPALPGNPGCPKRCLTACCKQLVSGNIKMGDFFFSQCSGTVCRLCGYNGRGVGAANSATVLQRLYLREWSRGVVAENAQPPVTPQAAAPNAPGAPAAAPIAPGALKCNSGDLC